MDSKDTYKTILEASKEVLFKDKNSKFYGYAFPITSEEQVKLHIDRLKKEHFSARHWCYSWQIGINQISYRANDDGEPNNSAGMPIYGQIQSFDVTNVLVVVVRYFGGVKLGVSGLINAYREAAKMALETSEIIEKTIDTLFQIEFEYKDMNKVMRVIKEKNLQIESQEMNESCTIVVSTRKSYAENVIKSFENLYEIEIKLLDE